jgi:hypothetical protein
MGNRLQTLLRGLAALFALAAFCLGVLWVLRALGVGLPTQLPTPLPDAAFEPLIFVILGLGSFVLWLIGKLFHQPLAAERVAVQARNNRAAMIAKVRTTWIDNVLRRSLYAEMRLDLPLAQRTDAVRPPQPALVQAQGERHIDLPPGMTILDLYVHP